MHFSIKFDGPALAAHTMDVRELAPALIALSDLLEQANKAADPQAAEVRVSVSGDFKGGSFGVDLIAVQSVARQLVSMLSGGEATATANLLGILGGLGLLGGGGVIGLIKWLRGRQPSRVRIDGERTVFELTDAHATETFEVDLVAGRLYQSRVVRQQLAKVLRPLERPGIDVFACARDGVTQAVVTSQECAWFAQAAAEADMVSDAVQSGVLLQVESAVFKDGNKWRFHDGSTAFAAEVTDPDFLARIESGAERFGKGDILVVDLRRVQYVVDSALRTECTVVRVIEHRAPLQARLL